MSDVYHKRLLHVDLTSSEIRSVPLDDMFIRDFVGGRGFAAKLMWEWATPRADPLGPENVLMFLPGPLTGTIAPSMRSLIAFKSPLTGTYCDSYHGGFLGPEIKYAGYDGIIITGQAAHPVYLRIDDDEVEICGAEDLWGLDTHQLYDSLYEKLGDPSYQLACCGPAGENRVRFALVDCSYHRQAGRGGGGAVMASKNLKAMAVRGTHVIQVADPERFLRAVDQACAEIRESPDSLELHHSGTGIVIPDDSEKGVLPTYNFRQASFEAADDLGASPHQERLWLRHTGCMSCLVSCGKMGVIRRGKHRGTVADNVEYESAALLGSNLGISRVEDLQYAAHLCDVYGLDTMSTGGVIGFAIEAYERGIINADDTDGLVLAFGAAPVILELITRIAHRKGIGELLAEGVKRVSEAWGQETRAFAMHSKGLETPGYEPRGLPGLALGYATGDRGGDHERSYTVHFEMRGALYNLKPVDRFTRQGKPEISIAVQNQKAGTDSLISCHFTPVSVPTCAELLNAATGWEIAHDYLDLVGERVWNLTRLFNLREGFTRADDDLPVRVKEEGLPDPVVKGQRIPQADLDAMLDEYYRLRGWDDQGVPTVEKLASLGLNVSRADSTED